MATSLAAKTSTRVNRAMIYLQDWDTIGSIYRSMNDGRGLPSNFHEKAFMKKQSTRMF